MKETFAALLSKPDVRMPHLTEALSGLLAKRLAGGSSGGNAPPATPAPADAAIVSRLLMRILSVDDVIYRKARMRLISPQPSRLLVKA